MRLFFGIPIAENISRSVEAGLEGVDLSFRGIKPVPPENFHFTLKFLGEVGEDNLSELKISAGSVSETSKEFRITLGRFDAFPSLDSPRTLFYSISEGGEKMAELAGRIDRQVCSLGFGRERRPFRSHLTVARVKKPLPAGIIEQLKNVPPLAADNSQVVSSFSLIRSRLSRSGARYEMIGEFSFPQK